MEKIREMEADVITEVTKYERLTTCTSQLHSILYLATVIQEHGSNTLPDGYCGLNKSMCHSKSAANRNLFLQILERESGEFLPYAAKIPQHIRLKDGSEGQTLFESPGRNEN